MVTSFKSPEASPQREAALFYALFLRGHRIEALRRDIDVPAATFAKWMRSADFDNGFRESLQKMYDFRKQVLAIFDSLVERQATLSRVQ